MGYKIPCLFTSRRARTRTLFFGPWGGGLLWFVQEAIAGGQGVLRSGLEHRPLKAEGMGNVSLDSSHSCSLMGLKGVVFGLS